VKEIVRKYPVTFSVIAVFVILITRLGVQYIVDPFGVSQLNPNGLLLSGSLNIIFTLPIMIMLSLVLGENGFKFTFSIKGFKSGMYALLPFLLAIFVIALGILIAFEMNREFLLSVLPALVFFEFTIGIAEESLFRGLFLVPMLIRWSGSERGRLGCVLVSGTVFGALHMVNIVIGADVSATLASSLAASVVGVAFAAALLRSKNLLSCIVIHAIWNITVKSANALTLYTPPLISSILDLLMLAMPIFAVNLALRSKPFVKDGNTRSGRPTM